MNFLEQLVAEWYEFRGYFVRRNIKVGKRAGGGYECELDVVAFDPKSRQLVHIEPSMDSDTWARREVRYRKKFDAGNKYIPALFPDFGDLPGIRQIALFGYGGKGPGTVAGGEVMLVSEFMSGIAGTIGPMKIASNAVPEIYPLLRAVQFTLQYIAKP